MKKNGVGKRIVTITLWDSPNCPDDTQEYTYKGRLIGLIESSAIHTIVERKKAIRKLISSATVTTSSISEHDVNGKRIAVVVTKDKPGEPPQRSILLTEELCMISTLSSDKSTLHIVTKDDNYITLEEEILKNE